MNTSLPRLSWLAALAVFTLTGSSAWAVSADVFDDATALGAVPATDSNDGATEDANEPDHAGNAGGASVWWTWKPAADGVYVINTRGSDFDTLLALYLGDTVNALTLLASNNDISTADTASEIYVRVSSAVTYRLVVDGAAAATGNITLDVKLQAAANQEANDDFSKAISLGNTATVTRAGSNARASREVNYTTLAQTELNHNGQGTGASVWYTWTAPSNGLFTIDTRGSVINTIVAVYQGTTVAGDTITYLAANNNLSTDAAEIDAEVLITATAGQLYRLAVDGVLTYNNETSRGSFTLNIKPSTAALTANDHFANAQTISGALPLNITGNSNTATREASEPTLANARGAASLWYKWTPTAEQDIKLDTLGTNFDTLLGVYTGTVLSTLAPVAVNNNIDASIPQSQVSFTAKANTTYYIVVDGIAGTTQRRGDIILRLQISLERTLLPRGETWEWIHPTNGADPAVTNANFDATWFTASYNNNPPFRAAAPGILGYGTINFSPGVITSIGLPADVANRYGAYFRKTFTLGANAEGVKAEILADDGAVIYIDGKEVARVNMPDEPDTYLLGALNATSTEDTMPIVDLGSIAAGQHLLAISIHNTVADGLGNSSDLGFDIRLFIPPKAQGGSIPLTAAGLKTGFEEADLAATSYIRPATGQELGFSQNNNRLRVINALNAADTVIPRKALRHNNATGGNFTITEAIAVGSFTSLEASILVHSFSASATNFEAADYVHVYMERSNDGLTWQTLGDVVPEVFGLDTDEEDDITLLNKNQELNGDWNTFKSAPLNLPVGTRFVRLVISSNNDSANEYVFFDDILIKPLGGGTGSSAVKITKISQAAGGTTLEYSSISGKKHRVEFSQDLKVWQSVNQADGTGSAISFTYAAAAGLKRGFYRVVTE